MLNLSYLDRKRNCSLLKKITFLSDVTPPVRCLTVLRYRFLLYNFIPQWSTAQNQTRRSGPEHITNSAAVAHSAQPNLSQWPIAHSKICRSGPSRGNTLEVEFLREFKSIFQTALDQESEDQLGTFGKITLHQKISRYCPLKGRPINEEIFDLLKLVGHSLYAGDYRLQNRNLNKKNNKGPVQT